MVQQESRQPGMSQQYLLLTQYDLLETLAPRQAPARHFDRVDDVLANAVKQRILVAKMMVQRGRADIEPGSDLTHRQSSKSHSADHADRDLDDLGDGKGGGKRRARLAGTFRIGTRQTGFSHVGSCKSAGQRHAKRL